MKDARQNEILDPRLWEHGDQFTLETWADLAKRIDPQSQAFFDRLFGLHPELAQEAMLFFFALQPEDVWMLFDCLPQRFGVQVDSLGETIVLFDTVFHHEVGSWSPDPITEAITILEQRYLGTKVQGLRIMNRPEV